MRQGSEFDGAVTVGIGVGVRKLIVIIFHLSALQNSLLQYLQHGIRYLTALSRMGDVVIHYTYTR
jgi:hypothetical protein